MRFILHFDMGVVPHNIHLPDDYDLSISNSQPLLVLASIFTLTSRVKSINAEADLVKAAKFMKESCPFTNFNRQRLFNCFLHSSIDFAAYLDLPLLCKLQQCNTSKKYTIKKVVYLLKLGKKTKLSLVNFSAYPDPPLIDYYR